MSQLKSLSDFDFINFLPAVTGVIGNRLQSQRLFLATTMKFLPQLPFEDVSDWHTQTPKVLLK